MGKILGFAYASSPLGHLRVPARMRASRRPALCVLAWLVMQFWTHVSSACTESSSSSAVNELLPATPQRQPLTTHRGALRWQKSLILALRARPRCPAAANRAYNLCLITPNQTFCSRARAQTTYIMGETNDDDYYNVLQQDKEEQEATAAEHQAEVQAELDEVAAMERTSALSFQNGCPFKMKEIVRHNGGLGEGKVVGLPDKNVLTTAYNNGMAWVHFAESGNRYWVKWSTLTVITAPAANKRHAELDKAPRTVQQKLNVTSRAPGPADVPNLPNMARIERDRAPKMKPPVGVRGRASTSRVTPESKVPIAARINQNPGETFRNSCNQLFCGACNCVIMNVIASINAHKKTAKHKSNVIKHNAKSSGDFEIMSGLSQWCAANPDHKGTNVKIETQLWRYRLTESFMAAGIEPSKINRMRTVLQRGNEVSTDCSHLMSMVPKVEADEFERIHNELLNQVVSAIFDGETRVGEAMALILRFCTADFRLHQVLVAFVTAEKHMNAQEMTNLFMQLLLTRLQLPIKKVVCFSRDSASVNGAAVRQLRQTFGLASDILCICHTLNHLGDHFELSTLDEFLTAFIKLVYSSAQAKELWRRTIGEGVKGYSNVRWWCKAEIAMQIARHFGQLKSFLDALVRLKIGDATTNTMTRIYTENNLTLMLEFAAMLDMVDVVSTTYKLEGDGLPSLVAFSMVEALRYKGRMLDQEGMLPNVEACLRNNTPLRIGLKIKKVGPGRPP